MLVISRKLNEIIYIDYDKDKPPIKVVPIAINGNRIKIAFEAPDEIGIWREEIYKRGEME
jgi:carbon storage regulator CsrA